MSKRRRGLDVNGTTTETAEYNTVFVDTSLGTHLAMLVSKSNTKMVLEHMKCFPKIVEIRIHSVKVKRRATFYHIPDSMQIWSAFHGVKGNWFLSVDASGIPSFDFNQNSSELGLSGCMKMEVMNVGTNCGGFLSDINGIQTLPSSFPGGVAAKYVDLGMIPEKNCMNTRSRPKKKRKTRHTQDAFHNSNFDATTEVLCVINDQCVLNEGSLVPAVVEKSNIGNIVNYQNHLGSDKKEERAVLENISPDMMDSEKEFEVCQDVWAREIAVNIQDTSKVGKTLKVASIQPYETHIPEEKHYSLKREVEVPSSYKASDQSIPDLTRKESPELTGRRKKRKKKGAKQLASTNIERLGTEQNDNGISGCSRLLCPISGHIPEETDKEEIILYPKRKDAQLELLDGSTQDADEKLLSAHGNEADLLTLSQTKQTLEAVDSGKRELDENTQNSAGNALGDFPVSEKEKQIMKSNQVEKDSDIKSKKKRKKIHTSSNVQENLTVKDQKVGVGLSRTEENLMNSEMEEIHLASSQVLSCKSEEKLQEKHGIAVITGDLARTEDDEGEGSNFKQYCVPVRYQDIVGSPDKLEKSSQSNMEMKTMKNVAKNGLPSNMIESILYPKGVDVQLELLDGSTLDADEKLLSVHGNEAHFMMLTQTKQTLKAAASWKEEMDKDSQTFAGNAHADFSVVEKDNHTVESNLVEKDSENTMNKDKKAKNKRKKKVLTISDLQENLTERDRYAGVGLSIAGESSMSNVNLEMEGIHVTSSQVVSRKSEEKLEEKHGIAVNTDDLARTAEDQGEGINFKQYLVPCQYQDKVCSPDEVKTASQEMKILKKVEKNGLPSDREEIILCSKGQNVPLLDSSNKDGDEKVLGAHGNEADSVMSTQTKQTLEAVASGNGEMDKDTQNYAVNAHADFHVSGKESQILDSDQVKDSDNAVNKDQKAKNKRKKKVLTTSDIQENLTEEQKVCVGVSTAEGNSKSYINSEMEELHVASSQVVSRKSEEKIEEKHEFAINTDDLARKNEDEGEGINFKQYFVPCQYQDKVPSPGKMKKASQSNMEMKYLKKVKRKGLSSVSISTDVESSLDLAANQESESKTRARKDSAKRHGDSATTIQKPMGTPESSLSHKKNASLKKSSSRSSEKVPEKREIKMSQSGLNGTNRMEMKTTEKSSLLAGAIFDDNSGESSADENGMTHLSGSTGSPSDSSSMSDYSVGKSNFRQDSIKNGSSDAKERSTGRKDKSKLDTLCTGEYDTAYDPEKLESVQEDKDDDLTG
ncbi:hypothetical protein OROGR_003712 [Orobanche gracilis]